MNGRNCIVPSPVSIRLIPPQIIRLCDVQPCIRNSYGRVVDGHPGEALSVRDGEGGVIATGVLLLLEHVHDAPKYLQQRK